MSSHKDRVIIGVSGDASVGIPDAHYIVEWPTGWLADDLLERRKEVRALLQACFSEIADERVWVQFPGEAEEEERIGQAWDRLAGSSKG